MMWYKKKKKYKLRKLYSCQAKWIGVCAFFFLVLFLNNVIFILFVLYYITITIHIIMFVNAAFMFSNRKGMQRGIWNLIGK